MKPTQRAIGIDLSAEAFYTVEVIASGSSAPAVSLGRAFRVDDLAQAVSFCEGAAQVAIDAPDAMSRGPHLHDGSLSPKFRTGRCSDVATSQPGGGPAVPWVTPTVDMEVPRWMVAGFTLWSALRDDGHDPMEVFPAGCFYRMNGRRWPAKKTTIQGRLDRIQLLRLYVELPRDIELWSHDGLDAAVAALVANHGREHGTPVEHRCPNPDGSRLWYPASPTPAQTDAAADRERSPERCHP